MKNKTHLILLFICLFLQVYAQEESKGVTLSEIRKNKYQLDLDVKNAFNGLSGSTLIFKKKYQTGEFIDVNAIKLIRFLATINNQITFTDDPTRKANDTTRLGLHPSDVIEFSIGIGFEKQIMHKKFVHYYGLDIIGNYVQYDDDVFNADIGGVIYNATNTTDRLLRVFKTGINPFFGIKYFLTDQISIGIETGVQIVYFNSKITELEYRQEIIDGQSTRVLHERTPFIAHGLLTKFNNLRFVNIGYAF